MLTPIYPGPPATPDPDSMWVCDHRAATPADLLIVQGWPHHATTGVIVYGSHRYDALSRARAAYWLDRGPDRALRAILVVAMAHGPDYPLDRPKFPTNLTRLLDLSYKLTNDYRFHKDGRTGCNLWLPRGESVPVRDRDRPDVAADPWPSDADS